MTSPHPIARSSTCPSGREQTGIWEEMRKGKGHLWARGWHAGAGEVTRQLGYPLCGVCTPRTSMGCLKSPALSQASGLYKELQSPGVTPWHTEWRLKKTDSRTGLGLLADDISWWGWALDMDFTVAPMPRFFFFFFLYNFPQ